MKFDYYTAPPQPVFDDIKINALKLWGSYQDPYRTEKISRIEHVENVKDNAWFIVAMFDHINQAKLLSMVSPETASMIRLARGY